MSKHRRFYNFMAIHCGLRCGHNSVYQDLMDAMQSVACNVHNAAYSLVSECVPSLRFVVCVHIYLHFISFKMHRCHRSSQFSIFEFRKRVYMAHKMNKLPHECCTHSTHALDTRPVHKSTGKLTVEMSNTEMPLATSG